MTCRLVIVAFGLLVLGCRMDNPAFDLEAGSDNADERPEGDGDSTGPSESGESLGESTGDGDGDGDGDPSESSSDGPAETTDGDCTLGSSCGPCQICDEMGECVIDVGGPCDGPSLHCADYLYGESAGICYRLPDVALAGRCSEQGICESSPASDCPLEKGAVHFACDPACVTNSEKCVQFGKAAETEMSAMCAVNGEPGPTCKTQCANGIESLVEQYGCVQGECQAMGIVAHCEGYACDVESVACLDACENNLQCAEQFTCLSSECVPG